MDKRRAKTAKRTAPTAWRKGPVLALLVALWLSPLSPPPPAQAETSLSSFLRKAWGRGVQAAEAQGQHEVKDDLDTPAHNAVVRVGTCTGVLIAPTLVLTAGHCTRPEPGSDGTPHPACKLLPGQARLAGAPWTSPYTWRAFPRGGIPIRFTARRDQHKMQIGTVAVSQPHCADMALVRLARAVPASVATPLAVMTSQPLSANRALGGSQLRYAGWGLPQGLQEAHPMRQTGSVRFWGVNTCFIAGLPPLRRNGQRIISGDSGAPLLVRRGEREIVAGIMWGKGSLDHRTCGPILPIPPERHGLYTPTYRLRVLGTESTPIGDWLRTMAPEAEHL